MSYYQIDFNEITLMKIKKTITEVEALQKQLKEEGYSLTIDQVLKLYECYQTTSKLDEINEQLEVIGAKLYEL